MENYQNLIDDLVSDSGEWHIDNKFFSKIITRDGWQHTFRFKNDRDMVIRIRSESIKSSNSRQEFIQEIRPPYLQRRKILQAGRVWRENFVGRIFRELAPPPPSVKPAGEVK